MLLCPDCNENGINSDGDIYFNGSLWTTAVALNENTNYYNNNGIYNYIFGYLDFMSDQLDQTQEYLGIIS
jgi:hypothetical protein